MIWYIPRMHLARYAWFFAVIIQNNRVICNVNAFLCECENGTLLFVIKLHRVKYNKSYRGLKLWVVFAHFLITRLSQILV